MMTKKSLLAPLAFILLAVCPTRADRLPPAPPFDLKEKTAETWVRRFL